MECLCLHYLCLCLRPTPALPACLYPLCFCGGWKKKEEEKKLKHADCRQLGLEAYKPAPLLLRGSAEGCRREVLKKQICSRIVSCLPVPSTLLLPWPATSPAACSTLHHLPTTFSPAPLLPPGPSYLPALLSLPAPAYPVEGCLARGCGDITASCGGGKKAGKGADRCGGRDAPFALPVSARTRLTLFWSSVPPGYCC